MGPAARLRTSGGWRSLVPACAPFGKCFPPVFFANSLKSPRLPAILPLLPTYAKEDFVPFLAPIPPTLRDLQALRNLSVRRVAAQAVLTGGVTGAVIGLFRAAYDWISGLAVALLRAHDPRDPLAMALIWGSLAALAALALLALRLEPLVGGSGIPQVELMVRGKARMCWWRVLLTKFWGTLVSLTGGLSVGREGPCIMMGAAVGEGVGRLWREGDARHMPRYLVGGAVAGMTAAFGAPLAGMCFAFEEMKTILSVPLLLFTGLCALSAWYMIDGLFGFGLVFPFQTLAPLRWNQWWLIPAMGLSMGLLGAFYNVVLLGLTRFQDRCRLLPRPLRVLLPFACAGALLYGYPQVLAGVGLSATALERLPLPLEGLLLLLAVKIAFSWLSFASSVSGGLLMPLLLMGSLAGACATALCNLALPVPPEQTATVLTLGMAGLFAASVRAPLTGAALLLEMTGAFHNAPVVVLTAYVAAFTANALHVEPVYDSLRRRCLELAGPPGSA